MRRSLWLLTATLLLLVAAPAAMAAEPTLGGSLAPTELIFERQPWVRIDNKANVPVVVTIVIDDADWKLERTTVTLAVGERAVIPVLQAGKGETLVTATFLPAVKGSGQDAATLILQGMARHEDWREVVPRLWPLLLLAALLAGLAALLHFSEALRRPQSPSW